MRLGFRRPVYRRLLILGIASVCVLALSHWYSVYERGRAVGLDQIRATTTKSDTIVLARDGSVLDVVRTDFTKRFFVWTPLWELPGHFVELLIRSEDRGFRRHHGVEWKALAAAAISLVQGKSRGGSTLSMQLANRLGLTSKHSLLRKFDQIVAAYALEKQLSKDQILEAYVNLVPFRGEQIGVASASWSMFGKIPSGLTTAEALALVATLPSPNATWLAIRQRACRLAQGDKRACAEIEQLPSKATEPISPQKAPHAARRLIYAHPKQGMIRSTIDPRVQQIALGAVQTALPPLARKQAHDAAAIVIRISDGEVLAYIGNRGIGGTAPEMDGVQTKRQAGSTLKPFIYGSAFEKRLLTPESNVEDTPANIVLGNAVYRPKNYDSQFWGVITARQALAASRNVPAVRVLQLVGSATVVDYLKRSGISSIRDAEHYGPSLALGSASVSLWELTNAYRTIANGGNASPLKLAMLYDQEALQQTRAFSPEAAFLVASVLSDRDARALAFGLNSALDTIHWSAVKTGTSRDMTDNWCIGFSGDYVVGVWVGNLTGKPMWNVSGVDGAGPIWSSIVNQLTAQAEIFAPVPPPSIFVDSSGGTSRYYIAGTEPRGELGSKPPRPRFIYPPNGLILGFDPDISESQKLVIRLRDNSNFSKLLVDGKQHATLADTAVWNISPGTHRLEIWDGTHLADSVTIHVRPGATSALGTAQAPSTDSITDRVTAMPEVVD